MAQTIQIANATYPDVPSIVCNKQGGGTAIFADPSGTTAAASDVAQGKYFLTSAGVLTQGTASGGGGGIGTLLLTEEIGQLTSSSTTAASTGKTLSVSGINSYDLLIVESSVKSVTNNRHIATARIIALTASSDIATKNSATMSSAWNCKASSAGAVTSRFGSTAYGVYPESCTISNGNASMPMYVRYQSTTTGTINGSYTARVYGVKLYDLIGV